VFLESGHTPDAQGTEHLGLGWPTVLAALDHDAVQVDPFIARATRPAAARESLLPEVAAPYFRAERISGRLGPAELDPGFSMLVALEGQGIASGEHGGRFELRGGDTVLVSHRAGRVLVEGDTTLIRCRPPAPETGAGPW
jgi:mannose-6-phosphate isomerase